MDSKSLNAYSSACERNKKPILSKLQSLLVDVNTVLEVGSGTGQHAVFFAENMPHLFWQTSDIMMNHSAIQQWIDGSNAKNIGSPLTLDVSQQAWPNHNYQCVYSSNTAHIMAWQEVIHFFQGASRALYQNGLFILYGPFQYNGQHTSQGNLEFDQSLTRQNPLMGIRDLVDIKRLAHSVNLREVYDFEMPANNRLLVYQKI